MRTVVYHIEFEIDEYIPGEDIDHDHLLDSLDDSVRNYTEKLQRLLGRTVRLKHTSVTVNPKCTCPFPSTEPDFDCPVHGR